MIEEIPKINIVIKPRHIKRLQNNIWSERSVPAKIKIKDIFYDCGITYRGNHTRTFEKKSYRVIFNEFNDNFNGNEIHLNAEYRDPSLIRNKLSQDFFKLINALAPGSQHIFVEINGKPRGIYLQLESVDKNFLYNRRKPDGAIFYATSNQANFSLFTADNEPKKSLLSGYELKEGKETDFQALEQFIIKINTLPRAEFGKEIIKYVDVKNYLLWLCGIVCTQNFDGFIQNYALYQNKETGLFEIIPWDYDATWGRDWDGKVMEYDYVPIEGYNTLTARILDVSEFREQYRTMLEEILNTIFTTSFLAPQIFNLYHQLEPYVMQDPYKKNSYRLFKREPEVILQFIENRNQFLREQLKKLK